MCIDSVADLNLNSEKALCMDQTAQHTFFVINGSNETKIVVVLFSKSV